jgi:hypothetical protein
VTSFLPDLFGITRIVPYGSSGIAWSTIDYRGGFVPNSKDRRNVSGSSQQPSFYSPDLGPMMQDLLHTLANIDFEHDAAIEKLELSATDPALKRKIMAKLKAQHCERREPYVKLLAELHNRAMPRVASAH